MKQKIVYITRCAYCEKETTHIARDHNINNRATDMDIYNMMINKQNSIQMIFCNGCGYTTLQIPIAWSGIEGKD